MRGSKKRINQIHQKGAQCNNKDNDKNDTADEIIIESRNRLEQKCPQAGISEHDFHQYGSGNNLAQCNRQGGNLGEKYVSNGVSKKNTAALQAFCLGKNDIVILETQHY